MKEKFVVPVGRLSDDKSYQVYLGKDGKLIECEVLAVKMNEDIDFLKLTLAEIEAIDPNYVPFARKVE